MFIKYIINAKNTQIMQTTGRKRKEKEKRLKISMQLTNTNKKKTRKECLANTVCKTKTKKDVK